MCSFPYVATTFKESQEIRKLNLIWQSIPNCKVGRVAPGTTKPQSSKTEPTFSLSSAVSTDMIASSLNKLMSKYNEFTENAYFMAVAVSKDIQTSVYQHNAPTMLALKNSILERENSGSLSNCSTGTGRSRVRAFGENTTFAEITNKIAGGR